MSEVSQRVHMDQPDHNISMDVTKILEVESKWFERGVKDQPSHGSEQGTCFTNNWSI